MNVVQKQDHKINFKMESNVKYKLCITTCAVIAETHTHTIIRVFCDFARFLGNFCQVFHHFLLFTIILRLKSECQLKSRKIEISRPGSKL